jgi:transcription-repair coupling factor (superfamily II helicase)
MEKGDIAMLPSNRCNKITRHAAKDGKAIKIYKLGSPAWKKLKAKNRESSRSAYDLIKLEYAKCRERIKGSSLNQTVTCKMS